MLSIFRLLVFVIEFDTSQNFTPSSVELAVGAANNRSNVQITLGPSSSAPHIAIGTLFKHNYLERTVPKSIYADFLIGLRYLMSAAPPLRPAAESVVWFHGAILAFVRSYVAAFNFTSFNLMSALECLCDVFETRQLPSWLVLIAIGHAAGTLVPPVNLVGRARWVQLQRIQNIWRVPQHILMARTEWNKGNDARTYQTQRGTSSSATKADPQEFALLNCLAARTALFFLTQEDVSINNVFPSFSSYSGAIPLIHCLNFSKQGSFSLT